MMTGLDGKSFEKYSISVALKDGSSLHLRPIQMSDEERLLALFSRMSKQTIYLRFHHVLTHMSREEARRFCTVDFVDTFALVGTLGEGLEERIIAVGRYARQPGANRAQIAFEVEDKYQGLGIGTHLLDQLAFAARDKGITMFEAEVLAENKDMMNVLINSGFNMQRHYQGTTYIGIMDLAPTDVVEQKSTEREKFTSIASLRAFLNPKSVAVIGASRRPNTIGNFVFRNLIQQDFKGVVYPVNPNAEVIAAIKALRERSPMREGVQRIGVQQVDVPDVERVERDLIGVLAPDVLHVAEPEPGPSTMEDERRDAEQQRACREQHGEQHASTRTHGEQGVRPQRDEENRVGLEAEGQSP